jgi:peptidyl-prolyl cis-trans isomerase SDCCAG10
MSSHYTTEPPPTASILLHTTAGQLTISLFAQQTPLTCRNFLQHVLDESYTNNIFHRVSPGFVIQTGDPTGTGEGGTNIYEDRDFERYDDDWARLMGREVGEKIDFGDEVHTRLKFNRRGLVGMAKGTDGTGYGSQFFITLGDCRAELDGKCTMFGRVEGDGIYNVVKIAEGQLVDGTERPMYPEKILKVEILEMPKGDAWSNMRKRQRVAERTTEAPTKKKVPKKKGGKTLLSFGGGDDEETDEVVVRPKKAKFNPILIDSSNISEPEPKANGSSKAHPSVEKARSPPVVPAKRKSRSPSHPRPAKRKASPPPNKSPSPSQRRRAPSFHDPTTQLPIRDPESPSRSPTPDPTRSKTSALQAEIAALKASMRRTIDAPAESKHKKSALEALIPATSTRGRKRPRPGETNAKDEANALKMLSAFKSRLESIDNTAPLTSDRPTENGHPPDPDKPAKQDATEADDEEAALCDLHFIANCQSCSNWDNADSAANPNADDDDGGGKWMSHSLSFAKDRLGKDLTWKKKNEEELVVIDPREKERELKEGRKRERDKGKGRDRRW